MKETIKFKALIGQSILSVSEKIIHLGATSTLDQTFSGSFSLYNNSTKLPTEFKIECSDKIKLSQTEGKLEGTEAHPTYSSKMINFQYQPHAFGFCTENLTIKNLSSPSQNLLIIICLFVDDKSLSWKLEDCLGYFFLLLIFPIPFLFLCSLFFVLCSFFFFF